MSQPPANEGIIGGMIRWMVENKVTPNLLMICLLVGGAFAATQIRQEVFPEFDLDRVSISVAYPGSSPEEIEQGIILAIEQAVRDIDGVKEMTSNANEGVGTVSLELTNNADGDEVRQEVQQAIDRIRTFPLDAEEPSVNLARRRREVVDIVIYGDVNEATLMELARQARDRLLASEDITQVDLDGVRSPEVHIEIPRETLRAHGLTLNEVAARIRAASAELPGGRIEPEGGEIQLRVTDRRQWAEEFAEIPVTTTSTGDVVRLGELAIVREDFEDVDRSSVYNRLPSIGLEVYRIGDQTPIQVSTAVRAVMEELTPDLPDGIQWDIRNDRSEMYKQRRDLLLKNILIGLLLVLTLLALFLEPNVAFWVTMGIPISFIGCMVLLPQWDVSINMISMFAFIVALGIVVDDAIVAGENIYEFRSRGYSYKEAAIKGAQDVATPIGFSIATNMVAFIPMAFVPGMAGKFWRVIPIVVCSVFFISWVESLFILPEHLSHGKKRRERQRGILGYVQFVFNRGILFFARKVYGPILGFLVRWRVATICLGVATFIAVLGYVQSGKIATIFFPRTESDTAYVGAVLPPGAPMSEAVRVRDTLLDTLDAIVAENGGSQLVEGTYASINGNQVEVRAYLTDPRVRPIPTSELTQQWRRRSGNIEGIERLRFEYDRGGPGAGAALNVELSHRDTAVLERASEDLADTLRTITNVTDVNDGRSAGKRQLDLRLTESGAALGMTSNELARQLRSSFLGNEAIRQQRIDEELRVRIRLPENERVSELDFEQLMVTTPSGQFVPLLEVASVDWGYSYTSIQRRDGRRILNVTGDVDPLSEVPGIQDRIGAEILPQLMADYPGLTYEFGGNERQRRDSMAALWKGFLGALGVIYFILAIPFRSYIQPMVVMTAIPFGLVGGVLGHIIMGFDLSFMSMMGLVALTGVLVNDSLLLVDTANKNMAANPEMSPVEAARLAGIRRFRPVILTTMTTFGGLAPMIFETSRQAQFMVPMAISLGFGIVFATMVTLVLVPSAYALIEDVRRLARFRR